MQKQFEKFEATGLGFADVSKVLSPLSCTEHADEDLAEYLAERGLSQYDVIPVASHSWGGREVDEVPTDDPLFIEEDLFCGEWGLYRESELSRVKFLSASSDSSLEGIKEIDGSWTLILEVPVNEDDEIYKGFYYELFHSLGKED